MKLVASWWQGGRFLLMPMPVPIGYPENRGEPEDSNLILYDGDVQTNPRSLASEIACDNILCSLAGALSYCENET